MANYLDNLDEGQKRVVEMIREQAQAQGVPVNLALSLAFAENGFRQYDQKGKVILSPKGAVGIMQVMPGTGKEYGFSRQDLTDPEKNIEAGVSVLKDFLSRSNGDSMMAAGMYNAGPNHSFFKTGKGDLPEETQNYIAKINGYGGFGEGEPEPNEPKQPVEVEPEPNEPTPEATIYEQDAANPDEDAQKNKEMATATGAVLGAGVGFAKSRINAAETKAMREEMARIRAQQQMARLNPQPAAPAAPAQPTARPGALPTTQGSPQLKGAQKWVQSLGNQVPYAIAEQAETMDKVRATGGQSLLNKDAEAMAKIRGMGEGRFQLTGEGRGQLMLPPGVADQAAQQQAQAAANEERLARIAADTERARLIRLQEEEANRPMNRARSVLNDLSKSPVGQIGARVANVMFQRFPVVGYATAGANITRNMAEAEEAARNKEYIDSILKAAAAGATGMSMYPPFAPFAVPAAGAIELTNALRERYR
jgi:hypothetical protein